MLCYYPRWKTFMKFLFISFVCFLAIFQLATSYFFSKKIIIVKSAEVGLDKYELETFVHLFDVLNNISVMITVLNMNMLKNEEVVEKSFVTFGIFEEQSDILKKAVSDDLFPSAWTFRDHQQVDYRVFGSTRTKQNISAHFSFTNNVGLTLHLAVIFPRNNYFWISEFTDHEFNVNLTLSLPIAVERFSCDFFTTYNEYRFCVPGDRDHYLWQLKQSKFMECHFEDLVWKFEKEYPQEEKMDTSPHASVLREVMRISRKFKLPIIIDSGTVLGWYRQCDFIVKSEDIDFGIFSSDFSEELFRELWFSKVIKMRDRLGTVEKNLELRFWGADTMMVDIFLMYPSGNNSYFTYMMIPSLEMLQRFEYPILTEICSADFLGILIYLPCNPLIYIEAEYGSDNWYHPKKDWRWANNVVVRNYTHHEVHNYHVHKYKKFCDSPSVLWGCDKVPGAIVL